MDQLMDGNKPVELQECEVCGRAFRNKTALLSHIRNVHPELRPEIDEGMENTLLKIIAPNGVPANSEILREVAAFLETAEQLRAQLARATKQ